ncbi:MAG: DUF924 family protein [Hyphomicrobiales bacterium]
MTNVTPRDVLDFWFEAGPKKWFAKDDDFDQAITATFQHANQLGRAGGLDAWTETPDGILALIILLDQFSRNMYRGSPDMYAADAKALTLSKEAIARGIDGELPDQARHFLYMPFMHSERLDDQQRCFEIFQSEGEELKLKHSKQHLETIKRFGRFPHRNEILERQSTQEELDFMASGGFAG